MSDTRPTPETDAKFEDLFGCEFDDYTPNQKEAKRFAARLERERDQLQRWKDEQMFVESQWDAQAVGRELGMIAGTDIRRNILPRIVRLKKERDEARAALSGRTVSCSQCNEAAKQIAAMREAIKEASDALLRMVGACRRYLEERPCSIHDGYDENYVSPLSQSQYALAKLKPFLP